MCSRFDRCVVVSEFDKSLLTKICPHGKYVMVPNGVDTEFYKPLHVEIVPNSLIWVGPMEDPHNKNAVDFFLRKILPVIQSGLPDIKVKFIGHSPTKTLIEKSKRNPNLEILGYVEDIRPHVSKAAVFIAPIISGSGTKLKVLTALALGKPVVTTSLGAEGIKVTPSDDLIIADNPKDFANETISLLKNAELRRKLGENGRNLIAREYSWKVITQKMNKIYEEIVY